MKCKNCAENIPPKFSYAVSQNLCPMCGEELMDENLRKILSALRSAFDAAAEEDMEQIEDWLFTNFQFKHVAENQVIIDKEKLEEMQAYNFQSVGNGAGRGTIVKRSEDDEGDDAVEMGDVGISHQGRKTRQPPQTIFAQRAAKLGGVDFKHDIEYIKGKVGQGGNAHPSEFVGAEAEDVAFDTSMSPAKPLDPRDANKLGNALFGGPDPVLEPEKVRRLQKQDMSNFGGNPKVSRNDD